MGKKHFEYEELNTLLVNIEDVINRRPLTIMPSGEVDKPIRPVDLLLPLIDDAALVNEEIEDPQDPEFVLEVERPDHVAKMFRRSQMRMQTFWKLWREQYLLVKDIMERMKWPIRRSDK